MKNSKKIFFIITCISVIFTIVSIVQTYAKYVTSVNGSASISIARWNIVVNNMSIKNNSDISSVISPIFPGNSNIAANVLAPNVEGYFDLAFDYSEVDVSFNYSISVSPNANSSVKDLIAIGYSIDNGAIESFTDSNNTITNHIGYTEDILAGNTSRTIRIYVKWNDDPSTSNMDNYADTYATLSDNNKRIARYPYFIYSNYLRSNNIYF